MGYSTYFQGGFSITPSLKPEHAAYLKAFAETRRMTRNAALTEQRPDPVRIAAGLPVGPRGAYFVGETGYAGQDAGPDVVTNEPDSDNGQPGYWCQWVPNNDGTELVWDEGEKFYNYIEWLKYVIVHFLQPWGYTLNGCVTWDGEDYDDNGEIEVTNNAIRVYDLILKRRSGRSI